ncbi:MAG: 50S ribosomal protein L6 [Erysipelotrichaceae bacterium]|nr:50S ribosomal protein L6 [Erysipelotrichaceae bacterium]
MSRIGKKSIVVPADVTVDIAADNTVTVKGPKGELVRQFSPVITIAHGTEEVHEGTEVKEIAVINVSRSSEIKTHKQLHGTTRAVLANMIEGVSKGFEKDLKIVGIGYRAQVQGQKLTLNIGYSNPVVMEIEEGVTVTCGSPTEIKVAGINKERVGQVAALIRAVRKPEPYKGKGIMYKDEKIIRKEGKTANKK